MTGTRPPPRLVDDDNLTFQLSQAYVFCLNESIVMPYDAVVEPALEV